MSFNMSRSQGSAAGEGRMKKLYCQIALRKGKSITEIVLPDDVLMIGGPTITMPSQAVLLL